MKFGRMLSDDLSEAVQKLIIINLLNTIKKLVITKKQTNNCNYLITKKLLLQWLKTSLPCLILFSKKKEV